MVCQAAKVKTKKGWKVYSRFHCSTCIVPLCIGERDCFGTYHRSLCDPRILETDGGQSGVHGNGSGQSGLPFTNMGESVVSDNNMRQSIMEGCQVYMSADYNTVKDKTPK